MATSLDKLEKRGTDLSSAPKTLSYGEKIVKISQYILRYSTKYASFLPCHTKCLQMSPFSLELLDQNSRHFYTI